MLVLAVILNLVLSTFEGGLAGFGLRIDRLGRDLFWAFVGYLAFWPICAGIAEGATWLLNTLVPSWTPPQHKVLIFLEEPGLSILWGVLAWTLAGLIAPLFEEILFRGLLLNWLRKASGSTWLAIVVSGLAFGVIHVPQWHLVPALDRPGPAAGLPLRPHRLADPGDPLPCHLQPANPGPDSAGPSAVPLTIRPAPGRAE